MTTILVSPISVALRDARERAGLTQVELAELAGVRQATISLLENPKDGQVRRLDLDVLDRLCAALKVEPGDLIVREGAKRRSPKR